MKNFFVAMKVRAASLMACGMFAVLTACSGGGGNELAPTKLLAVGSDSGTQEGNIAAEPAEAGSGLPSAGDPGLEGGAVQDVEAGDYAMSGYAPPSEGEEATDGGIANAGADTALDPPDVMTLVHANRQTLYVSPRGSDNNPGTLTRPFRSIARAARAVRPGTTVLVAPGTYSGGIRTNAHGRADARISFISTKKWGAKIVPPVNSSTKAAWDNRGHYVDVVGFEIDGRGHRNGTRWTHGIYNGGSFDSVRYNHVHHIAQQIKCSSGGGAAIGIDSYYRGVKSDAIANLVHDIGPADCHYVQGIYVSTSGSVKNNVIYRVAEAGIHLWHDASNVIITNNTVTASNTGIIVGGGNFYHTKGPNDHTLVYSNMVYENKMGISEQGRTGKNNSYRNNLVYGNSRFNWSLKNGLKHTGTVSSAPLLVANPASAADLKPSRSSPAVGRATAAHAASTDFEGRARNVRTGYDIGAFQH